MVAGIIIKARDLYNSVFKAHELKIEKIKYIKM